MSRIALHVSSQPSERARSTYGRMFSHQPRGPRPPPEAKRNLPSPPGVEKDALSKPLCKRPPICLCPDTLLSELQVSQIARNIAGQVGGTPEEMSQRSQGVGHE